MLEYQLHTPDEFTFINEEFYARTVAPLRLDALLSNGWRHFGTHFFRYNLSFYEGRVCRVIPLRIRLAAFSLSKNKRRILKKNRGLTTVIRPIEITPEKEILFERHKRRFGRGAPVSLYDYLSPEPASVPCNAMEVCVYENEKLLAASFFDVSERAVSSIYAIFTPEETSRSLGIFTMLLEIFFAQINDKEFYYHGYAYEGTSFYDYKKRFRGLEKFDWNGSWENFTESKI